MIKNTEKLIDKKACIELKGLLFEVIIKDIKRSYGKDRYLVIPVAGKGKVWIQNLQLL